MTAAALQLVQTAAPAPAATPVKPPTDISVLMLFGGRLHRGTVTTKLPNDIGERNAFFPAPRHQYAGETLAAVQAIANKILATRGVKHGGLEIVSDVAGAHEPTPAKPGRRAPAGLRHHVHGKPKTP